MQLPDLTVTYRLKSTALPSTKHDPNPSVRTQDCVAWIAAYSSLETRLCLIFPHQYPIPGVEGPRSGPPRYELCFSGCGGGSAAVGAPIGAAAAREGLRGLRTWNVKMPQGGGVADSQMHVWVPQQMLSDQFPYPELASSIAETWEGSIMNQPNPPHPPVPSHPALSLCSSLQA